MTKKTNTFRLICLFNPSYITGRLSDINSISDAFRRVCGVVIYMWYLSVNGFHKAFGCLISAKREAVGLFIFLRSRIKNLFYIVRGWGILAKEGFFNFLWKSAKIPIYTAHLALEVFYKARGRWIIGNKKISDFIRNILYLAKVFSKTRLNNSYYGVWSFLLRIKAKIYAVLIHFIKSFGTNGKMFFEWIGDKTRFFSDMRRDRVFRMGLDELKSMKYIYIRPVASLKQTEEKSIRALWLLHPFCNYRCSYCWVHDGRGNMFDGLTGYKKRTNDEYIKCWEHFNQRYGSAQIDIIGGEPFISPDFPDLLKALSVKNTMYIVSNLSWDPKTIIGRIDPTKLSFLFSYHPDCESSLEHFISKVTDLQRAGFFSIVAIVGWPPYFKKTSLWLKEFYIRGIEVMIEPFAGEWNGRTYPQSYTAFEKEAIRKINSHKYMFSSLRDKEFYDKSKTGKCHEKTDIDYATDFQMNNVSPKGKFCKAGSSYFKILFDGEVRRCSRGESLGEFYSGNYNLLGKAMPCPSDKCYCVGEIICLEEELYGLAANRE